jgi:hypothetical protein
MVVSLSLMTGSNKSGGGGGGGGSTDVKRTI